MGNYMDLIDSSFVIKKDNFTKALETLKQVIFSYQFLWVDTKSVLNSQSLEEALTEIRYKPEYNSEGDISNVSFIGQKRGSEDIIFDTLAPYVESNSYLHFKGQDHAEWVWRFTDRQAKLHFLKK